MSEGIPGGFPGRSPAGIPEETIEDIMNFQNFLGEISGGISEGNLAGID